MKKIKKPMVPRTITELLAAGQVAAGGAAQFGAAIGLVHNTQAAIEADGNALVTSRDAYQGGKATLTSCGAVVRSVSQTGRDFLRLSREVLKTRLGNKHSTAWGVTGFVDNFEVPTAPAKVQVRLQTMQTYLTANPDAQNEALNVTATRAGGLFTSLNTATVTKNVQKTTLSGLLATRNDATKQMRTRLQWLVEELGRLLDPMDDRWLAFGFKKPGAQVTPDVPKGVSAVLIGSTAAAIRWTAAPRAEHYRVWKKVAGVDTDFVAVGSAADLDFTIEGLPSNVTVEIAISAVNNGGESARSLAFTLLTK